MYINTSKILFVISVTSSFVHSSIATLVLIVQRAFHGTPSISKILPLPLYFFQAQGLPDILAVQFELFTRNKQVQHYSAQWHCASNFWLNLAQATPIDIECATLATRPAKCVSKENTGRGGSWNNYVVPPLAVKPSSKALVNHTS